MRTKLPSLSVRYYAGDEKGDSLVLDLLLARSCDDPRHYVLTIGELVCYTVTLVAWIVALGILGLLIAGVAYLVVLLNR